MSKWLQNQFFTRKQNKNPSIAVVFGAGGLKSFAGAALLPFLKERNINVDMVAGCSGGAFAAAVHSMGATGKELQEGSLLTDPNILKKIHYKTVAALARIPGFSITPDCSLLEYSPFRKLLRHHFKEFRVENMKPKLILQATDFHTGDPIEIESGLLRNAIYCSCAMRPLLPPRSFGGKLLCDGAYSDPLPIRSALRRGADVIIAMTFTHQPKENYGPFNDFNVFLERVIENHRKTNTIAMNGREHKLLNIRVKIPSSIGVSEIDQFDKVFEAGHSAILDHEEQILEMCA